MGTAANFTQDIDDSVARLARKRVSRKLGWYVHAFVFVTVNLGLAALAEFSGRHHYSYPLKGMNHMTSTTFAVLRWLATLVTACTLAALNVTSAHAATGVTVLPASATDGPVTVFYPTSAAQTQVKRGPFTVTVAADGAPERGNGRLIVVSHGSGASAWVYSDLAHDLVAAGFIVAVPEHAGDNWHDHSKIGPKSWKLRPLEISRAIDAITQDARFAPLVHAQRVGLWGMSAGGHTLRSRPSCGRPGLNCRLWPP